VKEYFVVSKTNKKTKEEEEEEEKKVMKSTHVFLSVYIITRDCIHS